MSTALVPSFAKHIDRVHPARREALLARAMIQRDMAETFAAMTMQVVQPIRGGRVITQADYSATQGQLATYTQALEHDLFEAIEEYAQYRIHNPLFNAQAAKPNASAFMAFMTSIQKS